MKIDEYYQSPSVVLIEEDHKYFDVIKNEAIKLPSVSELIGYFYPFNVEMIDPVILEAAINKGVCVHHKLSQYLKGEIVDLCEHSSHGNGVRSHLNEYSWIKNKLNMIKEKAVYSELSLSNGKFNGTFDLLYLDIEDKWHLVDFKTTSKLNQEKEILQLKLYELLIIDNFPEVKKIDFFEVYNSRNEAHYRFNQEQIQQANNQILELKNSSEFKDCF